MKGKISELEQRCKDLEIRRSTLIFDHEKEKAKWSLERDHLTTSKQEIQENVDRL